jgi:hypothetical protein
MSQLGKALLFATSAAKMGLMSTHASAACENNAFGLAVAGTSAIFTPASNGSKSGSGSSSTATLKARALTATSTLDFTITGIPPTGVSTVYIAYSTSKAAGGTWPASCKGQLELAPQNLEVVYGVGVNASELLLGNVSMGKVLPAFLSYTLSIRTEDLLANSKLAGDRLYFQALVVPGTSLSIPDATLSPVYEIQISRAPASGGK